MIKQILQLKSILIIFHFLFTIMQLKNPKISVSFDRDTIYLYNDLMEKAENDGITISKFIRKLLKEYYDTYH